MKPLGNTMRRKRAGAFQIVEKAYPANAALALHEHERAYVSFLLAGEYVEISRKEERRCASGTVIWHPTGEVHADQFHPCGGHLIDLQIDSSWLEEAAQELPLVSRARIFWGGLPYSLGLRLYRELGNSANSVEDAAIELLGFFFGGTLDRQPPSWFRRAMEMCSEIDEPKMTLGNLAQAVGVHPVHLSRSFRRYQGCTFSDYLTKVRVRKAFELLSHSNRSIMEVAYACGFADHAHLCRTFKKVTGFTPSQFRDDLQPCQYPPLLRIPYRLIRFKESPCGLCYKAGEAGGGGGAQEHCHAGGPITGANGGSNEKGNFAGRAVVTGRRLCGTAPAARRGT